MLIASFFNNENLEFVKSQILNLPQKGYDDVITFTSSFPQSVVYPPKVLSISSTTFRLKGKIINENFSANLETLVILEQSNPAEIVSRTFNF